MGFIFLNESSAKNSVISSNNLAGIDSQSNMVYSFARKGYDPLNFFSQDSTSKVMKYKFFQEHKAIIEPSADMIFHIYRNDLSTDLISNNYYFKVCSKSSGECQTGEYNQTTKDSSVIHFSCTPHELFSIKIYESSLSESPISASTGICLYIRREIRSLSSSDLETFVATAHTLWEHSDEDGQAKYGPNFHSNSFLLRFHHFNAAQMDADHIHDGIGFLTQHIKFTNIFETSMQAVNPSVALPYWDFTIDQAEGNGKPYQTFPFAENIFGTISLPQDFERGFVFENDKVDQAAIPDGLWAGLKTEFNTDYEDLKMGYGYMRAPWSMNPRLLL
jgi:hypothetical protein